MTASGLLKRLAIGALTLVLPIVALAEPIVINLSDEDEESFYSLEVNPLTGKSTIRTEYYEVNPEKFQRETGEE